MEMVETSSVKNKADLFQQTWKNTFKNFSFQNMMCKAQPASN